MAEQPRPTDPKEWRFRQPAGPALRRGALIAAPVGVLLAFELLTDSKLTGAISTGALLVGFVAFEAPARIRFVWQLLTAPLIGAAAALGVLTDRAGGPRRRRDAAARRRSAVSASRSRCGLRSLR